MRLNQKRIEWTAKIIIIFTLFLIIKGSIPAKRDNFYATTRVAIYMPKPALNTSSESFQVKEIAYKFEAEKLDPRTAALMEFFEARHSPLVNEATTFVTVADKYSLDWKLLPAIACKESGCGKAIPQNSYNPFGWGIYGDQVIYFKNWQEAIEMVGKNIKTNYYDSGLTTPEQIEPTYTPPSIAQGRPWSRGVNSLMKELRNP